MRTFFPVMLRKYGIDETDHYLMNVIIGITEAGKPATPLVKDLLDLKNATGFDFPELITRVRGLRTRGVVLYDGKKETEKAFQVNRWFLQDYLLLRANGGEPLEIEIAGTYYELFLNQKLIEQF